MKKKTPASGETGVRKRLERLGRREFVPRVDALRRQREGGKRRLGFQAGEEIAPAAGFPILRSDQTASAVEKEEHEGRASQRDRDGDEQGQKFLTGFSRFGEEEGHVQLQFCFRGLYRPLGEGLAWRAVVPSMCSHIAEL